MQSQENQDHVCKVVLVGDGRVGKSNLFNRFKDNNFDPESKITVGDESTTQDFILQDRSIKLQLWDTAGQERFKGIASTYYRGAQGALLVYDITQQDSFFNLERWLIQIREYAGRDIVLIVVGNKSDLNASQTVKSETASEFAKQNNCSFIEVSALDGSNIDVLFTQIVESSIYFNPEIHKRLLELKEPKQVL